jgi:hypothetical protein
MHRFNGRHRRQLLACSRENFPIARVVEGPSTRAAGTPTSPIVKPYMSGCAQASSVVVRACQEGSRSELLRLRMPTTRWHPVPRGPRRPHARRHAAERRAAHTDRLHSACQSQRDIDPVLRSPTLPASASGRRGVQKPLLERLPLSADTPVSSAVHEAVTALKPSWGDELEITEAIPWLLDNGRPVSSTVITGYWKDTGNVTDMVEVNRLALETIEPRLDGIVGRIWAL